MRMDMCRSSQGCAKHTMLHELLVMSAITMAARMLALTAFGGADGGTDLCIPAATFEAAKA